MTAPSTAASPAGVDLAARRPALSAQALTQDLTPGARFRDVRFSTYRPNPEYPSQQDALAALERFVTELGGEERHGFLGLRRRRAPGRGLYLDGGFGVGKTHLLASAWQAARARAEAGELGGPVAFLSFQDLMYLIGALGMLKAVDAFRDAALLCIDEFELDDPGNTHMANTFLGELMPGGVSVLATSNTQPGALGQGRFNAQDFARQIEAIAGRFGNLRLDGPDYRQRGSTPAEPLSPPEYAAWRARQDPATLAELAYPELDALLLQVHPARFSRLLDGVGAAGLLELRPLIDQGAALRLVHFLDKVYDLGLHAACTGAPLETLFHETYRHGAFAKKYARCLSRLSELLSEARAG